jgi:hypothetical protein
MFILTRALYTSEATRTSYKIMCLRSHQNIITIFASERTVTVYKIIYVLQKQLEYLRRLNTSEATTRRMDDNIMHFRSNRTGWSTANAVDLY